MVFGYGPSVSAGMSITSIVVVLALIGSLLLPKKIHYAFNGIVLMLLGILPFMYRAGMIRFDITAIPVVNYVVAFIIVIAGRELIMEGIKEEKKAVKYPSIIVGLVIIILTTIPVLFSMGAIGFNIPPYPPIINNVIYVVAGIFMIIGIFTLAKD